MKKILSLLIAMMLLLTVIPGMAEEEATLAGQVIILHTNDVHGRAVAGDGIWGYQAVSQIKKDLEAQGATVILVDAGDFSQGTPVVNLDTGASSVDFMNASGYDLSTLGNHEFDWGVDNMLQNIEKADFTVLCANLLYTNSGETVLPANKIVEAGEYKIGFFGLDTPETMTKAHPDKVKGVTFLAGEELFACAQAQIDELTNAGCDIIICVCHLGVDDESTGNRSIDLIANTTGLDVVIDGHSHSEIADIVLDKEGNEVMHMQTGSYFANIGMITIDAEGNMEGQLVAAPEASDVENKMYVPVDELVADIVNTRDAAVNAQLGEAFATTLVDLNGNKAPGVRTEETNLGDFCCDAMLWAAQQAYSSDVVAALTNGGGIRASIAAGEISMLDMKTVFPFGNCVAVLQVTGAELLEALEAATWSTPDAIGAFPQVSGIVYTINTTVEYAKGELYPDSTYYAPAAVGSRVTIESVGGQPWDAEAMYMIATNDFVAAGGDTYYAFKYAYTQTGVNTQLALEDALVNYVAEVLGGVIGEDYAAPMGRITIIAE